MNPQRRAFLATTALLSIPVALTACAVTPAATASVEQVIANIQSALSYMSPIVPLLSLFVPGASAYIPLVQAGLVAASNIFNTVTSTMTTAAAQPLVAQINTDLSAAMTAAGKAIALIPNQAKQTQAQAILATAQGVTSLLTQFVTGVAATVSTAAMGPVVAPLFTRVVR